VKVESPKPRFTVTTNRRQTRVEIPARRSWFLWSHLTVFLGFWAIGEIVAPISLLRDDTPSKQLVFVAIWFLVWTAAGAYVIYAWAWHLGGQEIIELDDRMLTKKRELFGLGIPKKFNVAEITNLRILPQSLPMRDTEERITAMMAEFWGLRGGIMAFDHGAKTYRFGFGVDEPEAQQIMEALALGRTSARE
jgi:hypothetical protein